MDVQDGLFVGHRPEGLGRDGRHGMHRQYQLRSAKPSGDPQSF